ncbi:serine protease, partial [Bacillus thuringiensis]|nr:serine protease [Bacillus thuringiensis]MED2678229.1 serine protease [Bacillus thuringiensis]
MSQNNSNDVKSNEVGLIPFEVLEVVSEVSEIPEGVKFINAPAVWEKSEK